MTENPIDLQIGATIRQFREERDISRDTLGAHLSTPVSGTAIEKYEAGINRVSASTLVEIAAVFKCRVTELFGGIPEIMKENTPPLQEIPSAPIREAVAVLISAITMEMSKGYRVKV